MAMQEPFGLQFMFSLGLLGPPAKRVTRGAGAPKEFDETCR